MQEIFILASSIFGLMAPIFFLVFKFVLNLDDLELYYIAGFFWPSYIQMMGVGLLTGWFNIIFGIAIVVGENIALYAFLGWIIWYGKTKNKVYYFIAPIPLILLWFWIYFPEFKVMVLDN